MKNALRYCGFFLVLALSTQSALAAGMSVPELKQRIATSGEELFCNGAGGKFMIGLSNSGEFRVKGLIYGGVFSSTKHIEAACENNRSVIACRLGLNSYVKTDLSTMEYITDNADSPGAKGSYFSSLGQMKVSALGDVEEIECVIQER